MAEIFNFYVQDNRTIQFPKNNLLEPIMQEDYKVATWRFRIPKTLNGIDMSAWAWWFVYTNAKNEKFSELLTLVDDIDEPDSYCTADYDIDYGISYNPGSFSFSLEAINAESGGAITGEWHTKTYSHKVDKTLQGNQAQWAETESDIISALIIEVQNRVSQLVGGATPLPVALKSLMTNHDKVYLYTGSESGESTGYWYYWNGTDFVPGGLYASGLTIDPTFTIRGSIADAKLTGDALAGKVAKPITSPNGTNGQLLRTLGNGQTEWTDFATPTSEQVGEAVGNWLDEHPEATTTVQDGAVTKAKLADSLKEQLTIVYGTVAEMIADTTLKSGMIAHTLGYYAVNDGGAAYYKIRGYVSSDVDDGGSILFLNDPSTLVAELIVDKDYVSVKQFGAYGIDESVDANADDTPMIKKAIEFGINNGYRVYFPKGIYICDSYTKNTGDYMWFKIGTGQSMHLFGEGRDSVIKRKSDSLVYSSTSIGHNVLIRIGPPNYNANIEYYPNSVTIESLAFDGNKRGQSDIETGGNYENSPVLYFHSNNAPRGHNNFESCRLENLYFYDPIADNIAFSGGHGSYKTTYITNVFCTGRTWIRHDFDFVAVPIGNIHMSNIVCDSIHGEYLGGYDTGLSPTDYILEGIKTRDLTFSGLSNIRASHVYVGEYLHLGRLVEGIFTDCVFNLVSDNNTLLSEVDGNIPIFRFNHCRFIINDLADNSRASKLYLYLRFDVLFNHCEFKNNATLTLDTDGDSVMDHNKAIPVDIARTSDLSLQKTVFDGCEFDESFYCTFSCNGGGGVVKLRNMSIGTYTGVTLLAAVGSDQCDEELENVIFNTKCKSIGQRTASTANNKIHGHVYCYDSNARLPASGAVPSVSVLKDLKRTIYISEPLTKTMFLKCTSTLLRTNDVFNNLDTTYRYGTLLPKDEFVYMGDDVRSNPVKWRSVWSDIGYDSNGMSNSGQKDGKDYVITDGIPVIAAAPDYMYGTGSEYIVSGGNRYIWNGSAWI